MQVGSEEEKRKESAGTQATNRFDTPVGRLLGGLAGPPVIRQETSSSLVWGL